MNIRQNFWKKFCIIFTFLMVMALPLGSTIASQGPADDRGGGLDGEHPAVENQLASINRGMDKVEDHLESLQQRIDNYFGIEEREDEDQKEDKVKPKIEDEVEATKVEEGDTLKESSLTGTFINPETEENVDGELNWVDETKTVEDSEEFGWKFIPEEEDAYEIITGYVKVEVEKTEEETENGEEEEEEEKDEIEKDIEDNRSVSFVNRLGALNNRLNAIEGRLDNVKDRARENNEDVQETEKRLNELEKEVEDEKERVKNLQEGILNEVKDNPDKEDYEEKDNIDPHHEWTVKFNQELNKETVNPKNIAVFQNVDDSLEIMEAEIKSGDDKDEIYLKSEEGFERGQRYTLILTTGIESEGGANLSRPIEMSFTIEE